MMRIALPLVLVAGVAAAGGRTRPARVAGDYTSNWDDVHLEQDGIRVHGTYVCCGGGTIEGRVDGRVVHLHWSEPNGAGEGEGVWTVTSDGRLDGTWGRDSSDSDGGPWNLEPKQQVAN